MSCGSTCLFAFPMMAKSLYFFASGHKNNDNMNKFVSLLDDDQKKIYGNIVRERLNLFVTGSLLGLMLALLYILFVKQNYNLLSLSNLCDLIVIQGFTTCLYYSVTPKSTYMTYHLKTREQVDAWTDIYKGMKTTQHKGMLWGLLGLLVLMLTGDSHVLGCAKKQVLVFFNQINDTKDNVTPAAKVVEDAVKQTNVVENLPKELPTPTDAVTPPDVSIPTTSTESLSESVTSDMLTQPTEARPSNLGEPTQVGGTYFHL